jgi:AmmeMemoRadiSam system protein A
MKKISDEFSLNLEEKRICVELARASIKYFFEEEHKYSLSSEEVSKLPKKLLEKKACFVTLMIHGDLRGCIGHLNAIQPLYKDIIENAFSAAFSDPRFDALTEDEFSLAEIEVSILTDPLPLEYKDTSDLLNKIIPKKDGLIISKGFRSATFLPSVWEEIASKEEFLSHLCLKAGLAPTEWQKGELSVQRYYAIKAK